ncbi:MAG: phosphatidate cytidylyltransferase [Planctomycetaceae bacterium]|jgi:phytol kinase|nr:phosphatidate cytidylyltransferase [Planctomycetaceae bacterium]MBT6154260.1 phosphatidate cytidylyltransferase [Planctomycetaceae bacterium]MBT6485560.1 phosphatidate cytidylyltransferase [Planctomycetaceae bacterium]MBT6496011.1 phosphatidate cytidylyltransferase [Planctomycetaceae bacterium]
MPDKTSTSAPITLEDDSLPQDQLETTDATHANSPKHSEFVRKLLHMSPGLLPFVFALVPHFDPLDWIAQAAIVTCCVVMTAVFLSLYRTVRRPGEDNLLSTAISYPAIIIVTVLLFPAHVELMGVVVVVLALGDGAAYIGGKTFGKRKLPWNPDKTWVGSLSFIAVSGPIATLAYMALADADGRHWEIATACGFAAAICGSMAESLPVRLTDNLRVGVSALLAVTAMQYALVGLTLF